MSEDRPAPGKKTFAFRPRNIALRAAIYSWLLVIASLLLYLALALPYQKRVIIGNMGSEARNIASSISQVTATAIVAEDYSSAIEHCMKVLKDSDSLLYVIITRNDGFSLVHTRKEWYQDQLEGEWRAPSASREASGGFRRSGIVDREVFNFSVPFGYSGIDWGWIHIGLSLEKYRADLRDLYIRTLVLIGVCVLITLAASLVFSRKLTRPIHTLDRITRRVAAGDLDARADVRTGDELESLADSFNRMTEGLRESRRELLLAQEYTEDVIRSLNDALVVVDAEGVIIRANAATLDLLGYPEEEILGLPIARILGEPDSVVRELLAGTARSGKDPAAMV
ncbi:MAG: HAMP domain-containing protein, partial [Thermodesulfobacteriota bacterium]